MATTKRGRRRPVTQAIKDRSAASRTAAREALHAYAVLCLNDPAELERFRDIAASIGWKLDPASDEPGYSLQNALLLAAQRRPLTHCGGFDYWLSQGRAVAEGEKSLGTFRHIGGRRPTRRRPRRKSWRRRLAVLQARAPLLREEGHVRRLPDRAARAVPALLAPSRPARTTAPRSARRTAPRSRPGPGPSRPA
ncbi:hypothetical protein GCM10020220_019310 [Nonomuraea rubra]|uniref:hypothetical protein n=1 Tax=Nonomuraea rubra TaxID=46180 RepID=UPI0031F04D06